MITDFFLNVGLFVSETIYNFAVLVAKVFKAI
jgi:hypothetical protein